MGRGPKKSPTKKEIKH